MVSVEHTVEVRAHHDPDGTPNVKFTCHGDDAAPCHNYPDTAEWDDSDEGLPKVAHKECWMQGWFDADYFEYVDRGAVDSGSGGATTVPNISRTGPVLVTYEHEYVSWVWDTALLPEPKGSGS